jgi:hypothetical protein
MQFETDFEKFPNGEINVLTQNKRTGEQKTFHGIIAEYAPGKRAVYFVIPAYLEIIGYCAI